MLVNIGTQLDFFDFDNFLLFTGFIGAFLRFIFKFAVIENFANWWICIGLDFNQIEAKILSFANSVLRIEHPKLFAFRVNTAYLWRTDGTIDARAVNCWRRITMWTCYVTLL